MTTHSARADGGAGGLTLGLRMLFLLLLGLGVFLATRGGGNAHVVGLLAAATVVWFLVGDDLTRRWTRGRPEPWLAVLCLLWVGLVLVSPTFVWVAFALWMLLGQRLRLPLAVAATAAMLAVGVWALAADAGRLTTGMALGPSVGAVVALGIALGVKRLERDMEERRRLVDELQSAHSEAAALQDELARVQRSVGAQDERTRLSREIHDTLAQGFSSILLLARAGRRSPDPALFERIETTAEENLAEARRVVAALAPTQLGAGLPGALSRLLERLGEETGIGTELHVDGSPEALGPMAEVGLLRAAQSALANVRGHAAASWVVVSLAVGGGEARLDVVDDGRGFDPATLPTRPGLTGGYGLLAMRARLAELGGGLEVESEPGAGTALTAWLPIGKVDP